MKGKRFALGGLVAALVVLAGVTHGLLADCGPFTDVGAGPPNFCPFILELYYLGITAGTSPTTFAPNDPVTRGQVAVFISKSFDQSLRRTSRRAALGRHWTPQNAGALGVTAVADGANGVESDGADLWVAHGFPSHSVSRVRASDGRALETWTGATRANSLCIVMGKILVTGNTDPGALYLIDPSSPPGAVVTAASDLGAFPQSIAFDGARFWVANVASISIVTPAAAPPWSVTTVSTGFTSLSGILFDGSSVWVSDTTGFKRLDAGGAVVQTVVMGNAGHAAFDGVNIWVPDFDAVQVVRASTGAIVTTLTGNGLNQGKAAAFDGQRILVTNLSGASVSLWKAADLAPLGSVPTAGGSNPRRVCSDGLDFWITTDGPGLIRF